MACRLLPFQRESRLGLRFGGDDDHGDHLNRFWAGIGTGLASTTLGRRKCHGHTTLFGASVFSFFSDQVCKRGLVPSSHRQRHDGAHVDVAQGQSSYPRPDAIDSVFEAGIRDGTFLKWHSAGAGDICYYHFKPRPALCNRAMLRVDAPMRMPARESDSAKRCRIGPEPHKHGGTS